MAKKKTWDEKMCSPAEPMVKSLAKGFAGFQPGDTVLIPTPRQIESYICQLKPGETRTVAEMREHFAKEHGADLTCPVTTGILLRVVCEASLDADSQVNAPFWRVLDPSSPTAQKLPCGPEWVAGKRADEA